MSQRIKGQEVELVLLLNGAPQQNFTLFRSLEIQWKLEIKEEGYIGETTQRYDTIFMGVSGRLEAHIDNAAVFNIINQFVDKARRREPGLRTNLKSTLNFPNGQRARIIVPEIEVGPIPLNFGGRGEYGALSLEYAASQAKALAQA